VDKLGWMKNLVVTVDVREDIRAGRQPCGRIMAAVESLQPQQALRLLVPFEPVPLYAVLGQRGFVHETQMLSDGTFEVIFRPGGAGAGSASPRPSAPAARGEASECGCGSAAAVIELDARGLEPPQPMTRILEAVERLHSGQTLVARTDRRPMHLYPLLEQRGCKAQTRALPDGSFETRIVRH
jgi:uncharacterized protein (DUF2249 family)